MNDESSGELIVGEIHNIICNVLYPSKTCSKGGLVKWRFGKVALLHLYCRLDPLIMLSKPMDIIYIISHHVPYRMSILHSLKEPKRKMYYI